MNEIAVRYLLFYMSEICFCLYERDSCDIFVDYMNEIAVRYLLFYMREMCFLYI